MAFYEHINPDCHCGRKPERLYYTKAESNALFATKDEVRNGTLAAPLYIVFDNDGMDALAWGETMTVRCTVFKGWQDMSALVTGWKVERDTGDAADDAVWNASAKARAFDGTLVIEHTAHRSDLGAEVSTVFTVTAYLKDGVKTQYTIEL